MKTNHEEMEHERLAALEELLTLHRVSLLYAFGSRGKELAAWMGGRVAALLPGDSDVDLGTRPRRGVRWTVREKVRLTQALEDFFGADRADLVVLPEADPFLAAEVIRGERLYAEDELEADEYDLFVLRRAGDLAPLERERLALVLGDES